MKLLKDPLPEPRPPPEVPSHSLMTLPEDDEHEEDDTSAAQVSFLGTMGTFCLPACAFKRYTSISPSVPFFLLYLKEVFWR